MADKEHRLVRGAAALKCPFISPVPPAARHRPQKPSKPPKPPKPPQKCNLNFNKAQKGGNLLQSRAENCHVRVNGHVCASGSARSGLQAVCQRLNQN